MNARSVPEWIGKTPDTTPPDRVRVRVFEAKNGRCHACGRKIATGENWTLEHLTALINGGENRESNLDVTCDWCLPEKNAADVAEKADVYRVKQKHLLPHKAKTRPMPGSKASGWRKPFNRNAERRT